MISRPTKSLPVLILVVLANFFSIQPALSLPKTVFAHMVNTPAAVRWGLGEGANAVEMDLRFDSNSDASYFQHSIGLQPCDCTCVCAIGSACPPESVCKALWSETGSHCKATSTASAMTTALGGSDVRSKLAVIYIDSKLDNSIRDFARAGRSIVNLLNQNTFANGYNGQVIINAGNIIYSDYLKGALEAAKASPYASKYFYTFDFEGTNYEAVWQELLRLGTNNIVYSTGISICSSQTFNDAIRASVAKPYAGVGIWTLDSSSSMQDYLNLGVTSIMTNKPSVAVSRIGAANIATPGNALVARQVPQPVPVVWECDCNYHSGGCTISKSAPPNHACKCSYKGAWTCGGKTVACPTWSSSYCRNPDASRESCNFGGGDCGGY